MASFSCHTDEGGKILKRANPSTIQNKFLVGYQGWFTCQGDGEPVGHGHHGWLHWFDKPIPEGGRPNTDVWPDVSAYSPSELYPVPGLQTKDGDPLFLFSSRNGKTVQRHFHWMAEHGVDGAFLQRFLGECDHEAGSHGTKRIRDEVLHHVREAAEREGRVFAIMYDVTGVPTERIQRVIEHDWAHLVRVKGVLDSPNYLKEKGRPVIGIWGLGFSSTTHTPGLLQSLAYFFRSTTPGGVYLFAGVPSQWRTSEGDAHPNPDFVNAFLDNFDAISPWSVGRYRTEAELDDKPGSVGERMRLDVAFLNEYNEREGKPRNRTVDYVPVVLPGGSGFNLSQGKWAFNDMKRNGGRFLWKQIDNANKLGVKTVYGAMWDEYDEGTAFMPIVEHKRKLPVSDKFQFLALDADGYDVPADWYMRICGFAAEGLRGERKIYETFPVKELQDYWSSRPKYEQVSHKSADFISGSSSGAAGSDAAAGSSSAGPDTGGQTYQEWLAQQKDDKEEAPPPPYTLEAEEEEAAAAAAAPAPVSAPVSVQAPAVASSHNPVAAQSVSPAIGSPAIASTSSYTSQTNTVTSTYPGQVSNHGPPNQPQSYPHSGYGSPPQSISPINTGVNHVTQAHVVGQNPVGALANEFGKQSISGETGGGRVSNISQPPLHPTHPAAKLNNAGAPYPGASSIARPQSQQGYSAGGPGHAAYPGPRPSTAQPQRPQSQQGGGSAAGWSQPQSQQQWPPQEWHVNNAPSGPNTGGANLSRPQTFSASSYHSGGDNLRPAAATSGNAGRPDNSQPASPLNQGAFTSHSPGPSSPFSTGFPQAPQSYPGGSAYPSHSPGPTTGSYNPSYAWSGASGAPPPNSGASSYYGQKPGSQAYGPSQGPQYPWGAPSTTPSSSGPMFPSAAPPSGFPNSGPSSNKPPVTHMPSAATGGMPSPDTVYAGAHGGPQFPGAGGGSSTNYFPGGVAGSSTYSGGSSYPGGPSYPVGHDSSGSGTTMPAPGPWIAASVGNNRPSSSGYNTPGSSSSPPAIPPRPSMPSSYASGSNATSSSGPAFPSAVTSTMDLAAGAMDKIVGKKTRIQLTSQVGSLASSGNKLFQKFTK